MFFPFGTTTDKAEIDSVDLHHVSMVDSLPHDGGTEGTVKYVGMTLFKDELIKEHNIKVSALRGRVRNKSICYAGVGLFSILALMGVIYTFKV